jgi:hypothetical protein
MERERFSDERIHTFKISIFRFINIYTGTISYNVLNQYDRKPEK